MRDRILAVAILVPIIVFGYSILANIRSNDRDAAQATAESYLKAACDEADDRGWSLLVSDQARAAFGSRDAYLERAQQSDCTRFSWRIGPTHCDDGVCFIYLTVADEASIPAFLADVGIVEWRTDKMSPGSNAGMAVQQRLILGQGVTVPVAHQGF